MAAMRPMMASVTHGLEWVRMVQWLFESKTSPRAGKILIRA